LTLSAGRVCIFVSPGLQDGKGEIALSCIALKFWEAVAVGAQMAKGRLLAPPKVSLSSSEAFPCFFACIQILQYLLASEYCGAVHLMKLSLGLPTTPCSTFKFLPSDAQA